MSYTVMKNESKEEKRGPGRPGKPLPPKIDASPEAVARVLVTAPPKKEHEWRYLDKEQKRDT